MHSGDDVTPTVADATPPVDDPNGDDYAARAAVDALNQFCACALKQHPPVAEAATEEPEPVTMRVKCRACNKPFEPDDMVCKGYDYDGCMVHSACSHIGTPPRKFSELMAGLEAAQKAERAKGRWDGTKTSDLKNLPLTFLDELDIPPRVEVSLRYLEIGYVETGREDFATADEATKRAHETIRDYLTTSMKVKA